MLIQQSFKFEESFKEKKQFRILKLRELLFNNVISIKGIEVWSRIYLAA